MDEREKGRGNILRVVGKGKGKGLYLRREKKRQENEKRKKTLFVGLRFVSVNESCKKT